MHLPHLPRCARGGKATRLALAAAFALSLSLPAPYMSEAATEETVTVLKQDGTPLFEMHFFSKGEAIDEDEGGAILSTWTLCDQQKNAVTSAVALWAEVLGPGSAKASPNTAEQPLCTWTVSTTIPCPFLWARTWRGAEKEKTARAWA